MAAVFGACFRTTKHASRLFNWWPVFLAILGFALPVFGLSLPRDGVGSVGEPWWVAMGVLILAGLFVRAGYLQTRELVRRDTPVMSATFAGGEFNTYVVDGRPGAGKYFHIRVESTALTRSVGGRVTAIRTVVNREFVPARLLAAVPLGWVRHKELRIDLRPGSAEHLTVLLDQSHHQQVLFSTDSYEPQGVPYGLPNGLHEIDILIDSDDGVPPVTLTLRVDAPGDWDGLNVWTRGEPEPVNERYR